jgi:class 3 adenylate cyclase
VSSHREEVARATEQIVAEEGQRNEWRVAIVRATSYGAIAAMDAVMVIPGYRPARNLIASGAMVLVSFILLFTIRKVRYRSIMGFVIPVIDAWMIATVLQRRIVTMGATTGLMAMCGIACGAFAATGGLRFDRKAAVWVSLLAGALLVYLVLPHSSGVTLIYEVFGVAGTGFLSWWQTDLVRRTLAAERGRSLLGRFLPRDLVEKAFRDPLALFSEPRAVQATLLVSDLRNFTAMAEKMTPSEVLETLNSVQGALAEEVQNAGGVVDKFMGDGMLAVFGAPGPTSDHADRALRAAAGIRRALAALNEGRPDGSKLRIGMGIHSGLVVAGCLGSGDRLEFTVLGDAVNTASRLEALTKEKGVDALASEETTRLAPSHQVRDLGEATLRGRVQPLRLFTLAKAE